MSVVDPQNNVFFPSNWTFGNRFLPHRFSTSSTGLSPEPTAVHRSNFNPLTDFPVVFFGICHGALYSHLRRTINHPNLTHSGARVPPQRSTPIPPIHQSIYPHGLQRSTGRPPTLRSTGSPFGASGGEGRERTPPQSLRNLRTLSITDYNQRSSQIIIGKVNRH